jgi:hypothetical protein
MKIKLPWKPMEAKVKAALLGATASSSVGSTFVLWGMGVLLWHKSANADSVNMAISAVPTPVAAVVIGVVAGLGAAFAGYAAPHTDPPLTFPMDTAGTSSTFTVYPGGSGTTVTPPLDTP